MTKDTNPFGDMTTIIEQFKVPGLDMAAIIASRRKDMEALVAANKATYEAMQALARKQIEILTQTMHGIQDSAKGLAGGADGASNPAKQADFVRNAYQKALVDMKDLAEMVRKSQADVMSIITTRGTQSLQEMKKLVQPA